MNGTNLDTEHIKEFPVLFMPTSFLIFSSTKTCIPYLKKKNNCIEILLIHVSISSFLEGKFSGMKEQHIWRLVV